MSSRCRSPGSSRVATSSMLTGMAARQSRTTTSAGGSSAAAGPSERPETAVGAGGGRARLGEPVPAVVAIPADFGELVTQAAQLPIQHGEGQPAIELSVPPDELARDQIRLIRRGEPVRLHVES